MNKNLILISGLVLAIILWLAAYFMFFYNWVSAPKTDTSKIDANFDKTVEEKAEQQLLDIEKQKLVSELNKAVKPNYIKITNWKDYPKLWSYTDVNVTFFALSFAPDINETTLADYDVRILKGSPTEEEYASKDQLYKEKTKNLLTNMLKQGQYGKLLDKWVVWTITKKWKNEYQIDFLGDYIYNKWWTNKTISSTTAGKIAILRDYFNFWSIYLSKQSDDIKKILDEVVKEVNDKSLTELSETISKIYFK